MNFEDPLSQSQPKIETNEQESEGFIDPEAAQYEADLNKSVEETEQSLKEINDDADKFLRGWGLRNMDSFVMWDDESLPKHLEFLRSKIGNHDGIANLEDLYEKRENLRKKQLYLFQQKQNTDPDLRGPYRVEPELPPEGY